MDLHDIGRGRGGVVAAVQRITVPVLSVGIWSDILYPSYQQREIARLVVESGGHADYVEIDSPHGHDSFLIELDQVGRAVTSLLDKV
jgi:homoserine O-acetyltransferase